MGSNDQWYTYLAGDDSFPDLVVSRVSVSTTDELENYLEKARLWREPKTTGWWRSTSLELADRGFLNSVRAIFERGLYRYYYPSAFHLRDYPMDVLRKFEAIGREGMEGRGARDDVVDKWNEGASVVEYLGHGGITVWSKEAMFMGLNRPDSDVDRLEEKDYAPFVFIRSCLSGAINWPTFPGEVSVSEALIRAKRKGATQIIGAVGTEQQADQERFATHLYSGLFNHGLDMIGEAKVYGHCKSILQNKRLEEVCNQYILHGEPTLAFLRPEVFNGISAKVSGSRLSLGLSVELEPLYSGRAQIRVHNLEDLVFESEVIETETDTVKA